MTQLNQWYPKGRKTGTALWLGYALVSLPAGVLSLSGDRLWLAVSYLVTAFFGGLMAWNVNSRRVEAHRRGLRVVDSWRSRFIPWEDVDEIRPDAHGAWATKLVVVKRDGAVVNLPLEPNETDLVKHWQESIAE